MKTSTVTKEQLAWLFVRGLGLYLGYTSLQGFATIVFLASTLETFNATLITPYLFTSIGSVYFLFFGDGAHRLLMYDRNARLQNPPSPALHLRTPPEREDPDTTLTPSEREAYSQWLEDSPELNELPLEDRIARFRDFQSRNPRK